MKKKLKEIKELVKELEETIGEGNTVRGAISAKQYEEVTGDKLIKRDPKKGKEKEIVIL